MSSNHQAVPRPFLILSFATLILGVVLFARAWGIIPPLVSLQLALLIVSVVVTENYASSLPEFSISLSYPLSMAAVVIAGPAAACIVAALSFTNLKELRSRRPLAVHAYNLGQLLVITALVGSLYLALGGRVLIAASGAAEMQASDFPGILLPLVATAAAGAVGNLALLGVAASLYQSRPLRESSALLMSLLPSQLALAFVGFLIGQVLTVNVFALPLFVVPLLVARQLYIRYTTMRTAFADTVKSLIGALEAKDHYTRGHSERVAAYSLEIGREIGLDSRSLERLEYAALLHDLGKLSLPASILRKPEALTDDERCLVVAHPDAGADMVARIPPLRDLADPVRHHHERYSGGGYPSGAAASEASAFGRILCIADSFDAMTTTRAYRSAMSTEAAIGELESGAGTQFDPGMVQAFVGFLRRKAAADPVVAESSRDTREAVAVVM